ncbi:MAG: hypothetical protein JSV30_03060 [Candidatus Omnitrophota bacterium]|nr:MAG: hypothetical protein JSV30_03060 [Candidatus Omnitrophota bacterium]
MLVLWLKFIVCAAIVVFSGYKICIYAEKIARALGVGHSFIGLILLAVVTSLPELSVAVSAVKIKALDLALSDLFGSNLFNLTIVGIIFLCFIKKPRTISFDATHFISSGFSVIMIALAAMGIVFYNFFSPITAYSPFLLDVETALILASYIFGAYLIFRSEKAPKPSAAKGRRRFKDGSTWFKFLVFSAILVAAAIYLSKLGNQIARIPVGGVALGGTFVGGLFIAIITSLPEVTVALSSIKLGYWDMAMGNIFGSNMFNMGIIAVADLALGRKIILSCASSLHLFTVLFVIISTALVTGGLVYRSRKKMPALAWDSVGIIFVYFAANLVIFYLR